MTGMASRHRTLHELTSCRPDLFTQLINILRSSTGPDAFRLHLPRALLIMLHIVKDLATASLVSTRKKLQGVASELLNVLGQIYVSKVEVWTKFFKFGGDDEGGALEAIENSLLTIKIIRRLIIAGYDFPGRETNVQEMWNLSRDHFRDFLPYVVQEGTPLGHGPRKMIERHLMQLSKLHLTMAQAHAVDFVLLNDSLWLVRTYWVLVSQLGETWGSKSLDGARIGTDGDAEDDDPPILERLGLKGLLLIRACVKMVFYPAQILRFRQPQEKEDKARAIEMVKKDLLTQDLVREMISALVTRFFVFRPSDLRMWEEEPDEWEKMEEGGEDWEFSIRPCAEKLFLDLAKNYKDLIIEPLLQVFYTVASEFPPTHCIAEH
jgi:hypothetical protein